MSDESAGDQEIEALIHPGDDGKFWAEVVGLRGCYAQGDNYSKILARLRDAHELCSRAPASPTPPISVISLAAGSTVADLQAALGAEGWQASADESPLHRLLQHRASGAQLSLPSDPQELLNSGFRQAVEKFLGKASA